VFTKSDHEKFMPIFQLAPWEQKVALYTLAGTKSGNLLLHADKKIACSEARP